MIEVKKKDNESFESLMKRFSRKVQQSGILVRARKIRYHERSKSENLKKRSALRREENRQKREEMKRLGLYTGRSGRR
jgi:ribosomal protein S21